MTEQLWLVFITGLTVGGVTCTAVQGGLLASTIASREKEVGSQSKTLPALAFLITKFIAYVLLGFLLGLFGQAISLTETARSVIQLFAGIYMVIIALNLLNIHPIFRYAIIQPPHFLTKLVRQESKSSDLFAPAILGFLTIFIPCGTTLAMEALAISSGSPIFGALIMAVFTLGTAPLFMGLGILTSVLGGSYKKRFLTIAGLIVLFLGLSSVNGSLILLNSPLTLQKLAAYIPIEINYSAGEQTVDANTAQVIDGVQFASINVSSSGYSPNYLQVKKDIPVKLKLQSNNVYSCALAFRIPEYGVVKNLKPTGTDVVEFTPVKSGRVAFACSMGMYTGTIEVI